MGIESAGRLIQNKNARIFEQDARDSKALFFSAGQPVPPLPRHRVTALVQRYDTVMKCSSLCRGDHLCVSGIRANIEQISAYGGMKQKGSLRNRPYEFTKIF